MSPIPVRARTRRLWGMSPMDGQAPNPDDLRMVNEVQPQPRAVPRWLKILVATLVGLVIVFYAAGGIVFSNMIYHDALTPEAPGHDYGVYVRSVSSDRIVLASAEERDDTTRPGVAGLYWATGYGLLGPVTETTDLDVSREFELISGELPPSCSDSLSQCDPVDIEGWAYPGGPTSVGLDFGEVLYQSPLGEMAAWEVDSGDGTVWAIHVHGWRASRREALRTLPIYAEAGITSLVIDYRNDPDEPADPSGIYRFGLSEWSDVKGAVQYALDHGAEQVVLVGYSTGAALDLSFLENSNLANHVAAIVFDSPNIDMGATVRFAATKRTLPGTPIPVPSSLTSTAMWVADLRWGVSWAEIDYVDRAAKIIQVPTLVFHGLEDDRVPVQVSRRLAAHAPDLVQLVEVEDAGHVTSWNVDPGRYEMILTNFLEESDVTSSAMGQVER